MSRFLLHFLTGVSALALVSCAQPPSGSDGKLSDEDKRGLQLAQSMAANGDLSAAQNAYLQLAQHPEAAVQADLALGEIDRRLGQNEDAVTVMRDAQKRDPGNPAVLTQLGYALIAANHPEDAVNVFDELIAIEPQDASAYNAKAVAFDKSGNHVAAQEIYQKALSLAPDSLAVRNNLAMSYILNGQVNDAITLLEPMVKNNTANATMRQNLALAYGLKGDKQRAMQLNLQDVTPEQAKDNMRFYEKYARARREQASTDSDGSTHVHMPNSVPVQGHKALQVMPAEPEDMDDNQDGDADNDAPVNETVAPSVPPVVTALQTQAAPPANDSFLGMDMVYQYPHH